ncbi:hypothetical protein HMPREF0990_02218 [Lachnospiraceae bacterium 1_1_57FAA]|nr:hypothetical protein HMPREF0990_02218 [Lachnospiraceae bacterium 1_1_57FAA]
MPLIAQERAVSYTGAVYPEHDICSGFFYKIAETKKGEEKMEEETGTVKMVMSKKKTVKMVKMGVMVAISVAMVYLVHFPIFPAVPFLEYDPADISILIGTFAFGPEAGLVLTVVTAVVQGLTVSAGSGLYGILMHMIATGVLVLVSGMIYNRKKTKATAVFGLTAGMAAMAVVMVGANLLITPMFMGVSKDVVWKLMPFIIGFNVIKAGINGAVTFLLYKRIAMFLRK